MSKAARNKALETISLALLGGRPRTFLAQAPLMAIVEAVLVLDEAGLLVDPEVADLDPDVPIPYTVTEFAEAAAWTADPMARSISAVGDTDVACPDCDQSAPQSNATPQPHPLPEIPAQTDAGRPCPECGVPVGLSGGCNNIDCKLCPF